MASSSMGSVRDWESCSTANHVSMKDSGKLTLGMAEVWNAIPTETDMRVSFLTVNLTGKAFIPGLTGKCTKVSGPWASKKAKASGKASSVTLISESGASPKPLGTESINGRTVIGSKVNGRIV